MSPTLSTLAKRLQAFCRAAMLIVLVVLLVPTAPTLLAGTASGSATRIAPAAAAAPLRAPSDDAPDLATATRAVSDYRAADYREASFTWDGGRSAPTGDPAPTTSPAADSVSDPAAGAPDPTTTTDTPPPSTTSPDATASAGDPGAGTADVSSPDPSSTPPSDAGTSPDATADNGRRLADRAGAVRGGTVGQRRGRIRSARRLRCAGSSPRSTWPAAPGRSAGRWTTAS